MYKNATICWECEARKLLYSSPLAMFKGLMVYHTITSIAKEFGVSKATIRAKMDYYGYERDYNHGGGPKVRKRVGEGELAAKKRSWQSPGARKRETPG